MTRALIVDNEVHAREELGLLLGQLGGVEVVGSCPNALQALQAIRTERPDLLFLDIQMPQVNGFQLLAMLDPEVTPQVVFVTAFDEYALKAFEENALDYLLKPVQPERLARAVEKARRLLAGGERPAYQVPPLERIPCSGAQSIKLVDLAEVEFVRSSAAGVYVVTARGELFTDLTLTVLESRGRLVRCHKQFLVNLDQVDEIRCPDGGPAALRMRSGKEVPVSRRLLLELKKRLGIRHRGSRSEAG